MNIISLIIIGISLSLDAFSVSLIYGLLKISNKKIIITSLTVGAFHFIMPLIGIKLSNIIFQILIIPPKYILVIIFSLIILEMVKSFKDEKIEYSLTPINILFFAIAVSLDSLTVGVGLNYVTNNCIVASFIFMIFSFSFTFIGMKFGKYISEKIGSYSKIFGVLLLLGYILYILIE